MKNDHIGSSGEGNNMIEFHYITLILTSILTSILLLLQFQQLTFSTGLALGALLGGLIGAIFTGVIQLLRDYIENKRKKHADGIKIYSRLKGEAPVLRQLYSNLSSYAIFIEYRTKSSNYLTKSEHSNNAKVIEMINEMDKEKPDLVKLHNQTAIDIAKYKEKWHKDLALIEVYFNNHQFGTNLKRFADKVESSEDKILEDLKKMRIETVEVPVKVTFDPLTETIEFVKVWAPEKESHFEKLNKEFEDSMNQLLGEIGKYF